MGQMSLLVDLPLVREDYKVVMQELCHTCKDCRLSIIHPDNRGVIWRGNLEAKIAVIGEAPGDEETEKGLPLIGRSGRLWEKWAAFMGLDTKKDCFLSNVAQCQPPKVKTSKEERPSQRAPDKDELESCFGPRCLRILRSMPNLEVVLTLGWVAAGCFLGEAKSKSHENNWFRSSILPGKAFYCMVHPSYILREPTQTKTGKVLEGLKRFKNEYLEGGKDILAIVNSMETDEAVGPGTK